MKPFHFRIKIMNSKNITQFVNCHILYKSEIIKEDLWVRDGFILNPEEIFFTEKKAANVKIDCKNMIISPGFIDLQINGEINLLFSIITVAQCFITILT